MEHLSKHKNLVDCVLDKEYGIQPKTKQELVETIQVIVDDQTSTE